MTAPPVRTPLLVLAYLAFISLGLPDGLLGVGWPSIRSTFEVSTEAVGLLLFAATAGYLSSSVLAGFSLARLGIGRLLAISTVLTGVALGGYAISPGLALMVGWALVAGLGSGGIDSGLNAYAASAFGPRHMNWMHASFGLGGTLGPLIMTAVLGVGLSWRWGYGVVAAAQLMLAVAFIATTRSWAAHRPPAEGAPVAARVPARETLALGRVWLGVLAFGLYVAVEVGAGLWAFLLLTEGRRVSATIAGICVSAYWGSLFVGRVVQGVVAERWGSAKVLRASLGGMAVGASLVALPGPGWLAVAGLMLLGFAAAPVFPLLMLLTPDRVGVAHADRAIGMQVAGAGVGAAVLPALIGVLLSRTTVEALGPCLLLLTVMLLILNATVLRPSKGPPPA